MFILNFEMHFRKRKNLRKRRVYAGFGADSRTRTDDLRITNALLYQLSHISITCCAAARLRLYYISRRKSREKSQLPRKNKTALPILQNLQQFGKNEFHSRLAHPVATQIAKLASIGLHLILHAKAKTDHAHRLFSCAATGTGNTGDANAHIALCRLSHAPCHLRRHLLADYAIIQDRVRLHAQKTNFRRIGIGYKAGIQHLGRIGYINQRAAAQPAGARLCK